MLLVVLYYRFIIQKNPAESRVYKSKYLSKKKFTERAKHEEMLIPYMITWR